MAGRGHSVSGHVPHDEGDAIFTQAQTFVPVATDKCRATGGEVTGGDFDAHGLGKILEHPALKADDDLMFLVVPLCLLDGFGAELCDGLQSALQLQVERLGSGPCEADSAERRAVGSVQRQRSCRADTSGEGVSKYLGKCSRYDSRSGKKTDVPERTATAIGNGASTGTSV